MQIVKLTAENVKRLKAVRITPDGNLVIVQGRNGQGKTSVLDSIWFALGGGAAQKDTPQPIRSGADRAEVTLDLGDLRVVRRWTKSGSTLTVTDKDGGKVASPQQLLDRLNGRLWFDPLAFSQQDDRAQLATLLELVELPFRPEEVAAQRKRLFDQRTEVGRELRRVQAQLEQMPLPEPGLPEEELSVADLLAELRGLQTVQAEQAALLAEHTRLERRRDEAMAAVAAAEAALLAAKEAADAASSELELCAERVEGLVPVDTAPVEEKLATVDQTNQKVRSRVSRETVLHQSLELLGQQDDLTHQIDELDRTKATALAAAAMPIEGLAFDDAGVTYRGVPFRQCSAAERLRVSLAMAMAMNPEIRVIRITDGSLLDDDNLALVAAMAEEHGYQVWIERVGRDGETGIVIEDGEVA